MTDQQSPSQPNWLHRVLVGLGLRDTLETPTIQRNLLYSFIAVAVLLGAVSTVLEIIAGEMTAFDSAIALAVAIAFAVIYRLVRSGRLIRASVMMLGTTWAVTLLLILAEEISVLVAITWFAVVITMSAILLTEWALLVTAAATIIVTPFSFSIQNPEMITGALMVFTTISAVIFMSRRVSRKNLIALKRAQQALEDENLVREYIIAELADSEHRYRALMEDAPVCHMVTDLETLRVEDLNPAGCELFGTSGFIAFRKRFKTIMDLLVHDDDRERVRDRINLFRSGETQPVATFLLQRADGTPFQARVQSSPTTLDNKPVLISIIQDVTEQNRMEALLRQNERRYRAIADTQGDMICRYDPYTLELTFVNEAYARWHGRSPESLTGTRFIDLIESDRQDQVRSIVATVLNTGQVQDSLHKVADRTGIERWHEWRDTIIYDDDGKILEIQAVGRDVTEAKRAEQALRESEERARALEERSRTILEAAPLAIVLSLASDGYIYYINHAGIELLGGTSADDFIGKHQQSFITPENRENAIKVFNDFLNGEETIEGQLVYLQRLDGQQILAEIGAVKITLLDEPASLIVLNDVTARIQAERERAAADMLRIDLEAERQMVKLRDSFITMISHEFRTPMTVIGSSNSILRDYHDRLDEERRHVHNQRIEEAVLHMTAMLDDILTISKANAGLLPFYPRPSVLPQVCARIVDEFRQSRKPKQAIQLSHGDDWPHTQVDEEILRVVLFHLLSNAVKYSEPETGVTVKLERKPSSSIIAITDQGMGIPEALQPTLFQAFSRGDDVRTIAGTGLGLAIAKAHTELHGGTLTFTSTPGEGTTFRVTLPDGLVNHGG